MKIVSPLLKRVVYPSLAKAGVFRRSAAGGLAVVTYHGILPTGYKLVDSALDGNLITADAFRGQLHVLKKNYNVISPEDMLAWSEQQRELPSRAVLLTCDDGLLNNLTEMLPILQQEGLRCLFFVTGASAEPSNGAERSVLWHEELFLIFLRAPSGRFEVACEGIEIGGGLGAPEQRRAVWWGSVKQLSQHDQESRKLFLRAARLHFGRNDSLNLTPISRRRFGLMTLSELRELVSAGMTIGAHTLSHPMLSQLPQELARAEITQSRDCLEAALQQRIWALAYPFGDPESVTPQVLAMAKEAGYTAAFLNYGGGLGTDLPLHAIPRVHVTAGMELAEFEACVAGFHASLQRSAGRIRQNTLRAARG